MTKSITAVTVILIVAAGGWLWGASGRWAAERSLRSFELRQDLLEGQNALLETRLDIYSVNFGDASKHLETARASLRRALDQVKKLEHVDDATKLEAALAGIDDAQRMSGNLDQNANTRSAEVATIVAGVLAAEAKEPIVK